MKVAVSMKINFPQWITFPFTAIYSSVRIMQFERLTGTLHWYLAIRLTADFQRWFHLTATNCPKDLDSCRPFSFQTQIWQQKCMLVPFLNYPQQSLFGGTWEYIPWWIEELMHNYTFSISLSQGSLWWQRCTGSSMKEYQHKIWSKWSKNYATKYFLI